MPHIKYGEYNASTTHPGENVHYENDLCRAIRCGSHVFLQGQTGRSFDGDIVVGDAGAQADQAMKNIKQLLEDAGSTLAHIVKMTVFVTDWRHREPVYAAIASHMKGIHYCSTGVTVSGLNRVQCFVEVDAHAVIPDEDL